MDVLTIFLFLFGLFFGSFFLVIIDRIPKKQSPFLGRSHCDHCNHTLAWYDLIPFFSFLSTGGKCRYCHKKLSNFYPIVEITTGILFALTPWLSLSGNSLSPVTMQTYMGMAYLLFVVSTFIIVFFMDLRYGIIPFAVVLPGSLIAALYILITTPGDFLNHLLSAIGALVLFLLLFFITRGRGMGFGDVVLVFYLGLILGFPGIGMTLYLAFLTGAAVSLIQILTGKKRLKGGTVPFGPFLIFAAFLSLFWSTELQQFFSFLFIR